MSYDPHTRSALLRALSDELDPSIERIDLARRRYRDLGGWLREHAGLTAQRDLEAYPQGSFNLGTTNQDPFTGDFDVDLVLRVDYRKAEISQVDLNRQVNGWLGGYVSARQNADHSLAPHSLEKGKRAWTEVFSAS